MRRQLSSRLTFFQKFVFPAVWISGFAFVTVTLSVTRSMPLEMSVLFGILTLIGFLVFRHRLFPLKTVFADDDGLFVGNFFDEVRVPYSDIVDVRESTMFSWRATTIVLKQPGRFGLTIRFLPYLAFVWSGEHPATALLRRRIRETC